MLSAYNIAVLALPAKPSGLRQRFLHHWRSVHKNLDAYICFMRQPSRQPLERALYDIMIIAPLGIDRNACARVLVGKYHWVLRRGVAHPQHDDGFDLRP